MCEVTRKDIDQVHENCKDIAVMRTDISHILDGISEIKDNHLAHISDHIIEINKKIDTLEKVQNTQSPFVGILSEVVKTAIMGLVIAGMVVVGINR